jgi:hypothetical protein
MIDEKLLEGISEEVLKTYDYFRDKIEYYDNTGKLVNTFYCDVDSELNNGVITDDCKEPCTKVYKYNLENGYIVRIITEHHRDYVYFKL